MTPLKLIHSILLIQTTCILNYLCKDKVILNVLDFIVQVTT